MKSIKNIFRRKPKAEPMPLRIEGIAHAPMTPEPDDAELAAKALLEHIIEGEIKPQTSRSASPLGSSKNLKPQPPDHYRQLAAKIKTAHQMDARLALRYVAYCEEMLKEPTATDPLATLMQGLLRHQDAAEREGGELKHRWQHCIANIVLAQML